MRRVSVFGVTPGMRLARPIRGPKGEMLLAGGMSLTVTHLRLLRERGVFLIDVQDGLTDDIEIDDVLSEEVRNKSLNAVRSIHSFLAKASGGMDTLPEEQAIQSLHSASFARATRDQRPLHALADAAMAIVDQILSTDTVLGLNTIRLYDDYTFQHSVGCAVAGVVIGRDLGWPREQLCYLATGCLMHDIGKIFLDREVLNKPGRLTEEETLVMQEHSRLGYETVLQIFGPGVLSNHVPYQHHEKQDGTGYPRGLRGDNQLPNPWLRNPPATILPLAQVASVADVYDALNSDRPYRPTMPPDQLIKLMSEMGGASLNGAIVERFLATLSPFPVGSEVMLSGPAALHACKGVVLALNRNAARRPVVRVLFDALGNQLTPFEVNLLEAPEVEIQSTLICAVGALTPLAPEEGVAMLQVADVAARQEMASPSICG